MLTTLSVVLFNVAAAIGVIALLFKSQVTMRSMLLVAATVFLIAMVLNDGATAWYAGVWAAMLALTSGVMLTREISAKSTAKFTNREKMLYSVFRGLQADEFRDLLKITSWNTAKEHTRLTNQDEICGNLYYVLRGNTEVSKDDNIFTLQPNVFIGEVGYFLRSGASATTVIEQNAVYVSWKTSELRALEEESAGVRAKIYELINKDMAMKVAMSQR